LQKMGARIDVSGSGRTAMVHGPTPLHGATVSALDIRSGAALVLAGLAAEGVTEVTNAVYIDRGYEDFVGKLRGLGAIIERRDSSVDACPVERGEEPIDWGVVPYRIETNA
ncbi:MAG: hypothetical protein H5T71_05050, partial [Chloroflexi bacterium]|nr:hypothetical protein [Chloroflexota bacterium]